jgi:SagB-type dehydrogenase family enzyme
MKSGIGQQFLEQTQYQYLGDSDQKRGLPQPPLELDREESGTIVTLPPPGDLPEFAVELRTAIERRRSKRTYADQPLSLVELSYLLWCTQGVKETIDTYATLRTVPSAGARHAFETLLLVNNIQTLDPGLYRFSAMQHHLLKLKTAAGLAEEITRACWDQAQVKRSAVTFFWVAVPYRMTWRYGERGYRYLHLDAGHVCQNLYLAAEGIDAGVCAIAAFEDEKLNRALDLDGLDEFVIYLAAVGKKPK